MTNRDYIDHLDNIDQTRLEPKQAISATSEYQTQVELTPSTFSMEVIARTEEAVYVRLPLELQRDCGGCSCPTCTKDPSRANWDTLVVPVSSGRSYGDTHTYTVHMPDPEEFKRVIAHRRGGSR